VFRDDSSLLGSGMITIYAEITRHLSQRPSGARSSFGGVLPRVSPGAKFDRPSGTKNEPRGCITAYAEVTKGNCRCFAALSMTMRQDLVGAYDRLSGNYVLISTAEYHNPAVCGQAAINLRADS